MGLFVPPEAPIDSPSTKKFSFSANLLIPALSLLALFIVATKVCHDYNVTSFESSNVVLAGLSSFPYFLAFIFAFFVKNKNQRISFYGALGFLAFMTAFEWIGPRTAQMSSVYSVIWFFQTVFVIPFLIYTVGTEK